MLLFPVIDLKVSEGIANFSKLLVCLQDALRALQELFMGDDILDLAQLIQEAGKANFFTVGKVGGFSSHTRIRKVSWFFRPSSVGRQVKILTEW